MQRLVLRRRWGCFTVKFDKAELLRLPERNFSHKGGGEESGILDRRRLCLNR